MSGNSQWADDFKAGVNDIMRELSCDITIIKETAGSYIDATNKTKGKTWTPSSLTCEAVIYDYNKWEIDGTVIQQGDKKCLVEVDGLKGYVPTITDQVSYGGTYFHIINIETIRLVDVDIAYVFQLRR